ncbi:PepSY domain-containing protein [Herpetosiphon sp. NSE202]|uniref:PepSY domain-containing protein n=1 Tax=Herpetosiphon sp. NSE202 TaxID=3351349 RepID=UPI00362766BF
MKPKFALLIAAVLTAFVLVIVAGVVRSLAQPSPIELAAGLDNSLPNNNDVQATATVQAYQQQLLEANQRIEEANRTIDEANARLQEPIVVREPAPAQPPIAQAPAQPQPAAQDPLPATQAPAVPQYPISAEQASQLALAAAPGASLLATPELVNYAGTAAYEVRLDRGLVYIDATTGAVLANNAVAPPTQAPAPPAPTNAPAPSTISADAAASAAVAYLGGGTVERVELEEEHGALVYEVRFTNDSRVYVDAYSGSVVYAKIESSKDSSGSGGDDKKDDDKKDDDK